MSLTGEKGAQTQSQKKSVDKSCGGERRGGRYQNAQNNHSRQKEENLKVPAMRIAKMQKKKKKRKGGRY